MRRPPPRRHPTTTNRWSRAAPRRRATSFAARAPASRARRTTSRGSSARRCTSASVCKTESCRCAATSARSSARMRSRFSSTSACASRDNPGPITSARPTITAMEATNAPRSALHESAVMTNATTPVATHAPPAITRASAPRRVPTSTARASAASGGRRRRIGHAGNSAVGVAGSVRMASSARPAIAAASGHTITSPGHSPTARTRSSPPNTTAPNAIVDTTSASRRRRGSTGPAASGITAQATR